jgi:hypothetical protein
LARRRKCHVASVRVAQGGIKKAAEGIKGASRWEDVSHAIYDTLAAV